MATQFKLGLKVRSGADLTLTDLLYQVQPLLPMFDAARPEQEKSWWGKGWEG